MNIYNTKFNWENRALIPTKLDEMSQEIDKVRGKNKIDDFDINALLQLIDEMKKDPNLAIYYYYDVQLNRMMAEIKNDKRISSRVLQKKKRKWMK